jgi:hypothetical protein
VGPEVGQGADAVSRAPRFTPRSALTGTGGQVSPLVAGGLPGPTERDRASPSARATAAIATMTSPIANNRPTRWLRVLAMASP